MHELHVQVVVVHGEEPAEQGGDARHKLPQKFHNSSLSPARVVVKDLERRVERLLAQHSAHVVVDRLARLRGWHGAVVHQRVRQPADVELVGVAAEFLLDETLAAGHALAADVVVHDYHVAVEFAGGFKHLQDVAVAADGVRAHGRAAVPVGHVAEHFVPVGGVHQVVARERVHVYYGRDAPAVVEPGRHLAVVGGAAAPHHGAVTRVGYCVYAAFDALIEELEYLGALLVEVFVCALLVEVDAEEALADAVHAYGVRGGVYVPALELFARDLVYSLQALGEGVPVEFLAQLFFQESYSLAELVHGKLLRRRVIVHERRDEGVYGLASVVGELTVHDGVVHHVGVAGVVCAQPAVAQIRVLVLDGHAYLGQRQRAHVLRYADGDALVYVVRAHLLYHQRQHEGALLVDIHAVVAREAEHDVAGKGVVKGDGPGRPLGLAELAVGAYHLPEYIHAVGYHGVERVAVAAQHEPAVAGNPLVDHVRRDEV